jgi:hypothetical protein
MELPDPYLYSQFWLMNLGLPVTWDNPDVRLHRNGVEAHPYALLPDTEYRVEVMLHNNSVAKAASGTTARILWIEFGVGGAVAARHLIDEKQVDIPAHGHAAEHVPVTTTWRTPVQPAHYCIEIQLSHPADGNAGNNRGWQNTVIRDAAPGETARVEIPVFNAFPASGYKDGRFRESISEVHLTLDSYRLEIPLRWTEADVEAAFAPVDPVWNAALDQTRLHLVPGSGGNVTLHLAVPTDATAGERQAFNIGGTVKGRPVGGVTVLVVVREA